MTEDFVVAINTSAYIILFIICLLKFKWYNLSTVLGGLYAISSIFALILYYFPLYNLTFSSSGHITWEPMLYQFVTNGLLITAFNKCRLDSCYRISGYSLNFINKVQKWLLYLFIIYLIFSLPNSIIHYYSGKNLAEMRDEVYGNNNLSDSLIASTIGRIFGSMSIFLLGIICIRYFLFRSFKKIDKYSLIIYFLLKLNVILSMVTRQVIIFTLVEIIITLVLFNSYINNKARKRILIYGSICTIFFWGIFSDITSSRFSSRNNIEQDFSTLRYIGESQLNFMALEWPDLKQPFYGWSQFPLFRRIIGMDYDDGTKRDGINVYNIYVQKKYHYYNPTYIFHGVVGEWCFNWGYITTFVLSLWFNIKFRESFKKWNTISFFQIILTILLASYIGKGIFYADYQFESGNFMIIFMFLIWLHLKRHGKCVNTCLNKME